MATHVGEALDDHEIEGFLEERGLGVLGLARRGDAYTFPIAFAFDRAESRCILRFVMDTESRKRRFARATTEACLTAYEWEGPADWLSVVVRGPLRELAPDAVASAAALFSDVGAEAALDVFNDPIGTYETTWYALEAETMTGRGRFS